MTCSDPSLRSLRASLSRPLQRVRYVSPFKNACALVVPPVPVPLS